MVSPRAERTRGRNESERASAATDLPDKFLAIDGDRRWTNSLVDLTADAQPAVAVALVATLREPRTTIGGVNLVSGFRPELWAGFAPDSAPPGVASFDESLVGSVRRRDTAVVPSLEPARVGCGVRPACRAEVTREAGQLGGGDPWVHDQHPRAALHDHRLVLEELAPVDGDPVRDRRQHAIPYPRVLVPSLTSSSSSWSNVSGFQLVAPDAIAASSASFDG